MKVDKWWNLRRNRRSFILIAKVLYTYLSNYFLCLEKHQNENEEEYRNDDHRSLS